MTIEDKDELNSENRGNNIRMARLNKNFTQADVCGMNLVIFVNLLVLKMVRNISIPFEIIVLSRVLSTQLKIQSRH